MRKSAVTKLKSAKKILDAKSTRRPLTAISLKDALWDTLQEVKAGEVTPASGDVVASQAREILRAVRAQLSIFGQAGRPVSNELVNFATKK